MTEEQHGVRMKLNKTKFPPTTNTQPLSSPLYRQPKYPSRNILCISLANIYSMGVVKEIDFHKISCSEYKDQVQVGFGQSKLEF